MIKTPHSRGRIYAVALAGMAMVGGILLLAFGAPVLHRMMVKPGAVQMLEIAPFDRVVLIQGPEITRIRVDVIYDRGERQAVGFPEGLAHYVEHLAHFNAADHQDDRAIERHSNAWTTTKATGYFASGSPDQLRSLLRRVTATAQPISDLPADFAAQERGIVLREYEARGTTPAKAAQEAEYLRALAGGAGWARAVIGTPDSIARFTQAIAADLHSRTHRLSQATLVVAGPFDPRDLKRAIAALSLPVARPVVPRPIPQITLPQVGVDMARVPTRGTDMARVLWAQVIPRSACDTPAHCDVLWELVLDRLGAARAGGMLGPLSYDAFLTQRVGLSVFDLGADHRVLEMTAEPDVGVPIEDLWHGMQDALRQSLATPVTQDDLDRLKNGWQDRRRDEQNPVTYTFRLVQGQLAQGAPMYDIHAERAALAAITPQDMTDVLAQIAAADRAVVRLYAKP
ncbi:MAG: M16 family metallopeptidase [Paracoccaceae bacterium]